MILDRIALSAKGVTPLASWTCVTGFSMSGRQI
jgi:hypothetical protein